MGKIYDDWTRLVEAVVRHNKNNEIAMSHSRDHSITTDDGSSMCSFDSTLESPLDSVAMASLEAEFRDILFCQTSPIESFYEQLEHQGSISGVHEIDLIPHETVYNLCCIAKRMICAGHSREFIQVYARARKSSMYVHLRKLSVLKSNIGDIATREWETLETDIQCWIREAKIWVRVLFPIERRLCKQIFEGLESSTSVCDACIIETIEGPAFHLLSFADAISIIRPSPEKLFKVLDVHDALSELLPDIESESTESIRIQAVEILSRLAETARGILSEFENGVLHHEPSKNPVFGGTIHPLTRYVMNYVRIISDYKQALLELILSRPSAGSMYSNDPNMPHMDLSEFEGDASVLALHLIWITAILQFNLEGKSRHYKDHSLAHFFMMNNIHYIVQKIQGSPELKEMIGDDYLRMLTGKLRLAATSYQRATWVRVLHCLSDEGIYNRGSPGFSKSVLRQRFKSFNAIFKEVHRTQATWFIHDSQLREELKISISIKLLPCYRSFLGRFRGKIESWRHPNYIKYSVEDLENAVLDFFEGCPVPSI